MEQSEICFIMRLFQYFFVGNNGFKDRSIENSLSLPWESTKGKGSGRRRNLLLNLHVKNLAIIDEVEVDFAKQFNVLTGETGAGKSIIIGSINIALGGKVSKNMIRQEAEFALVELVFLIEEEEKRKELEELGVSFEDDTLLISRKITSARTINRMNGESVTLQMIKKVADCLIDIHGQNEQQSLLHKAKHLEILDQYAKEKMQDTLEQLGKTYQEHRKLVEELEKEQIPEEERLREISFLEYELEEIQNAHLLPGEEEQLAQEYKKLSNGTEIAKGLGEIYEMTSQGSNSISEYLTQSIRVLNRIASYDEKVEDFLEQLSDVDNLVTDFNRDIGNYMDEFQVDDEKFMEIEKRLDLIRGIKSKYGATTERVMEYAKGLQDKLERYQQYDQYRSGLKEKIKETEEKYKKLAQNVTGVRKKAAQTLEKEITKALVDLNFLQVKFQIAVRKREEFTPNGMDDIEFMLSTNPGEPMRPIGSAASGGELSRIMLAIKAVLGEHDQIDTMIFDEIDVGISGRTAQKVAEKMALIGSRHQVICISHLAQIAAMADTQFLIEKENNKEHTHTEIRQLNEEEAVWELARILGGAEITQAVEESAREMKELANQVKKQIR